MAAYISLLLLLCPFAVSAQTPAYCDTLIQKGINQMWKKQYAKSLELLTEARALAEKNHWYRQQFLANNNIGANYYSMLLYGEALHHYLESYKIAVEELEPKEEMIVLNNIAIVYTKEKHYDKARYYFRKAHDIAQTNKDDIKTGLYAMNLGNLANETGNPKEARIYITEALEKLKTDPELFKLAQSGLAENDLLSGNARQAREKAELLYKTTPNLDFNDSGTSLLMIIAKSYFLEKNYPMAAKTAQKILDSNPNEDTRKTVYELLAEVSRDSDKYDDALRYKDSIISAISDLEKRKNQTLLKNNEVKFEVQNYKNEIAAKEEKLSAARKLFYYIIAIIVAVVAIIILILRNISVKLRQKKLIAERNEQVMALELEKEKTENLLLEKQISEKETAALLEQERLKNEIEVRNRKLSAKALYLAERNQMIEEFIASFSGIKDPSQDNTLTALKNHLKTDQEWDSFVVHFEEVNHGFINRLKTLHPSLNANDLRFISYIYMNLSTKEIASMLNVTPEACRKRKERISAKMQLPANVSLYDYLSTL